MVATLAAVDLGATTRPTATTTAVQAVTSPAAPTTSLQATRYRPWPRKLGLLLSGLAPGTLQAKAGS